MLAIVTTHPVQYQAPWFRRLAASMDIEVLYAHRQDATGQAEAGFGVEFDWDTPLLEGYPFQWLRNVARSPTVKTFGGCDTPDLYEMLHPRRFDACLILGWNRKCYLQAAAACWRNGLPLLVRGDSQLETRRSQMVRLIKSVPYHLLLPRCSAHLYVGHRNRAYLERFGVPQAKLFFCPHSVDNAYFQSGAERARLDRTCQRLRRSLGIGPNDFVALFVGKLIEKKRAADFIRACGSVEATISCSRLHGVLVGDGPLRGQLEELARPWVSRIHFTGFRNQSELPTWYASADALVVCSDSEETWGLVVNEAMACGVPAVVSEAVGCSPDLIEAGRTGYTYPLGDIKAMAACLTSLDRAVQLDSAELRRGLSEKMAVYSFDRATQGLEAALETVCRRRQARNRLRDAAATSAAQQRP
ncbi:MAG TPA: glycosyltransferase family 4 protein [Blastocatellia bacterium]|nr:glycosyltransferase family 4 protein [Blastocatellia bacterium]